MSDPDDESAIGCTGTTHVKCPNAASTLDLIVAGGARYLLCGIEHHTNACSANRMACTHEPARRIDRDIAVERSALRFDRFPGTPRWCDPKVFDRHVLRHRKAVVGFNGIELIDT